MSERSPEENKPLDVKVIEAEYPREWVLIAVTGFDEHNFPVEGRVFAHSIRREGIGEVLKLMTRDEVLASRPLYIIKSRAGITKMGIAMEIRAMIKLMEQTQSG